MQRIRAWITLWPADVWRFGGGQQAATVPGVRLHASEHGSLTLPLAAGGRPGRRHGRGPAAPRAAPCWRQTPSARAQLARPRCAAVLPPPAKHIVSARMHTYCLTPRHSKVLTK